jgi:hypothetical protein
MLSVIHDRQNPLDSALNIKLKHRSSELVTIVLAERLHHGTYPNIAKDQNILQQMTVPST